jgi:hypothetical protein
MILHFNGAYAGVRFTALHRRRDDRRGPYARPTDWITQAGSTMAWGHTKREALASLKSALGISEDNNVVQFRGHDAQ